MYRRDKLTQARHQAARKRMAVARLTPRWLRVAGTLILTLIVGGTGQIPVAQALKPPIIDYYMELFAPRYNFCTNQIATFDVRILGRLVVDGNPDEGIQIVTGVGINEKIDDHNIMDFARNVPVTNGFNPSESAPYSTVFKYKAGNKPGKTTIHYKGVVRTERPQAEWPVSLDVPVKVVTCKFKLSGTTQFSPNANYNPMIPEPGFIVQMDATVMTADADGHFTGSAPLHWRSSGETGSACKVVEKFPSDGGKAYIIGQISPDGLEVVFSLTYKTRVLASFTVTCDGVSQGSPTDPHLLDPVSFGASTSIDQGQTIPVSQSYDQSTFVGNAKFTVTTGEVK